MYGWRKRNTSLLREAVNYFNHLNYLFKETIYSNTKLSPRSSLNTLTLFSCVLDFISTLSPFLDFTAG